ncbi:MAG: hypothetical protein HKN98_06915 [Silicimonas sp.]|nr:hypothetical protein [Silicimonas sp.]NND21022.1 hypothetical protein [Silicimonas sp.]NND40877.1 hypothetical protein [Silicimonas sp.]NNF91732.1 hypothetical protein [Boseongicola sp.]NNL36663.1 hypothetical protein [Silicimonas sp.]
MRLALFLMALATPTAAQEGLRGTDEVLNRTAMEDLLSGQVIEFFDGSKSRYETDGSYGYTYTDDGPVWSGRYRLMDQSQVCVDFDNGSARCDLIVRDGERVVLITTDGMRFPVRNQSVAPN